MGSAVTRPNPKQIDLSHFVVEKTLGRGGFGKVHVIEHRKTKQLSALKRMAKDIVIKREDFIQLVWDERNIMAKIAAARSPFLLNLKHAFQDSKELYFVLEFMQGGDVRYQCKHNKITEETVAFYCAEMVLGLEALHSLHILYRDMKPDNALLDTDGHLRLSDFGLSVQLEEKDGWRTRGRAGTIGYMAPEMLTNRDYGVEADYWALGVTAYQMLHGHLPWTALATDVLHSMVSQHHTDRAGPISDRDIDNKFRVGEFNKRVSHEARSFIRSLLTIDPNQRLGGGGRGGWREIKQHPFLARTDWKAMANREVDPPIKPTPDKANFDGIADLNDQFLDAKPKSIPAEEQRHFRGFEYAVALEPEEKKQ